MIQFLLARIADDEARAGAALRRSAQTVRAGSTCNREVADLAARDARAVRQACLAKRTRIGQLQHDLLFRDRVEDADIRADALAQLREMLTPYRAHATYRPEWQARPLTQT